MPRALGATLASISFLLVLTTRKAGATCSINISNDVIACSTTAKSVDL